jgi:hypothetical protein
MPASRMRRSAASHDVRPWNCTRTTRRSKIRRRDTRTPRSPVRQRHRHASFARLTSMSFSGLLRRERRKGRETQTTARTQVTTRTKLPTTRSCAMEATREAHEDLTETVSHFAFRAAPEPFPLLPFLLTFCLCCSRSDDVILETVLREGVDTPGAGNRLDGIGVTTKPHRTSSCTCMGKDGEGRLLQFGCLFAGNPHSLLVTDSLGGT